MKVRYALLMLVALLAAAAQVPLRPATVANLTAIEPNLVFNAAPDQGIAVNQFAADTAGVCLTRKSASGTFFAIWESASKGTFYGKGAGADLTAANACKVSTGAQPAGFVQTGW